MRYYYLLLTLSLPIFSCQVLMQGRLTDEKITNFSSRLPTITQENLEQEKANIDKLAKFIQDAKTKLALVLEINHSLEELIKRIDKKKQRNQFIDYSLACGKNKALALRLTVYLKNALVIHICMQKNLSSFHQ